jgi:hypothetical protein
MNETRKQRFERLATRRVNRILNDLRLLGNLSNRSSYDYTENEIKKIFIAIEYSTKNAKSKFTFIKRVKFKL